jgi:hypothetical protein
LAYAKRSPENNTQRANIDIRASYLSGYSNLTTQVNFFAVGVALLSVLEGTPSATPAEVDHLSKRVILLARGAR